MKRFSDFAKPNEVMTGDKIKIDDVLDVEIQIIGYKISDSKYNNKLNSKVLTLQIILNEVERVIFTGSEVLMNQIEKYQEEIPFITTIVKINNYYTFS